VPAPTIAQAYASRRPVLLRAQQDDRRTRQTTEVVNQLRREFNERDALYRDIDDVLFGNVPVEIPDAYKKTAIEVRSPLALHIANTITAALSINPFTIQFRPIGFGDTYQQNATLRERFFESSWARQEEESRRRLLRLFMANLAVKGEGILKTLERTKRAWGSYDLKSKQLYDELKADQAFDPHARDLIYNTKTEQMKLVAPYPIATTDVPPETFYYTKTEDGMTYAAEVKTLPWFDALQRFHAGLDSRGRVVPNAEAWQDPGALGLARSEWEQVMSRTKSITIVEAWDWETVNYIAIGPGQTSSVSSSLGNGTLVKEVKHGYGDPFLKTLRGPYFHALGITTASRLPERAGLSILFGFLRLFPLLDSLYTMRGNAGFMTGFPAFKRTLPPGTIPGIPGGIGPYGNDGTEDEAAEEIEPGAIYPYDIAPVEMPKAGPEADKLIADVRQMIELALPSIVQGVVAGSESGYALNQAAHLARLAWDPIVSNGEQCLGERCGFESWLIEKRIGETVYAWGEQQGQGRKQKGMKAGWLGLGPDDTQGVHKYKARLDPETPSNKVIEIRAIGEQMDRQLITYEDAVEQAGANPDEVERSWLVRKYKASDDMQQRVFDAVTQKLAMKQAKAMTAPGMPSPDQLAGMPAGGGQLGQGGMPANPVPLPGQGLPLQPPPNGVTPLGPLGNRPGGIAGNPVVPNTPQNAVPLPGQR
jgi:hypothetical protein